MATQLQIRRDTATDLALVTPVVGEVGMDITNKRLILGDGDRAGGTPHANFFDIINQTFQAAVVTGTANAIALTVPYAPDTYVEPMRVVFKIAITNTGAVTVNVNGEGALALKRYVSGVKTALVAGELAANQYVSAVYDGVDFVIEGGIGGITSVSQGDLNTSSGVVSVTSSGSVVLPGGQYGFFPQLRANAAGYGVIAQLYGSGTSYVQRLAMVCVNSDTLSAIDINSGSSEYFTMAVGASDAGVAGTAYAQQRYVSASPPFDMGDGEAAGFMFALVNAAGVAKAFYFADVPPWAYNGPTDIRADYQCPATGRKFRRKVDATIAGIMSGRKRCRPGRDYLQSKGDLEEITQDIKQRDMKLIPHPFAGHASDLKPILIDPMNSKLGDLLAYQAAGGAGDLIAAIEAGKIRFDNTALKRHAPPGVGVHALKYKSSK
jgi:hypothetical protein